MPAQDRFRGDQAMGWQRSGQPLDESGEDGAVRPVQDWSWVGPAEHSDLVTQHEQFNVLVGDGRASSKTSLSTCRKSRYNSRSDTTAIMPDR
jgi:hypothetical protein